MQTLKSVFDKSLRSCFEDQNIDNLIQALEKGGFYTAPCSGAYHLSEKGGLLEHSLNVADIAKKIAFILPEAKNITSVIKCALLHDVGKMGQFGKPNYVENILKTTGKQSTTKPYVTNSDLLYVPHEIRSIQIVSQYVELTEEESFAILHHNGMYGDLKYTLNGHETPLQMILHFADMWASRVVEK